MLNSAVRTSRVSSFSCVINLSSLFCLQLSKDRNMVLVRWLICLYFIFILRGLCTIAKVVRPERKLAKSDTDFVHNNISTSHNFSDAKRHAADCDHDKKKYQRTVRSLQNTTGTVAKNRTEYPTPSRIIRLVNITFPVFKVFNPIPITLPPVQVNCPGEPYSCSKQCSNDTFVHYPSSRKGNGKKCYCDSACNVFMDCCGDFAQECEKYYVKDETDDVYSHRFSWHCETELKVLINECTGLSSVWMIARCPGNWPNDTTKMKCHNPPSTLEVHSYDSFVPVVGSVDQLTYRNKYCAQCNNVFNYEFMTLSFKKDAIPPPYYTQEELEKFIAKNHRQFRGVEPIRGQAIRFCFYPNVVSTCPKTFPGANDACVNGVGGLVEREGRVFKNKECALCNGVKYTCAVRKLVPVFCSFTPTAVSRAISLRDYGVSLEGRSCPRNQVYDPYLGKCRKNFQVTKLEKGTEDKYQVILSLLKTQFFMPVVERRLLVREIALYFKMNESQITIEEVTSKFSEHLVSFTLNLTPSQYLIVASNPQFLGNSTEIIGLRRLFKFQQPFELQILGGQHIVYRLRVRQLVCIHQHVYRFGEYTILDDLRIRINSTGTFYGQDEYYLNTTNVRPNVTVCLKLSPLNCSGSQIMLNSSEYNLLPNLTLRYSSLTYVFGDYAYMNGTVFVCTEFRQNYTQLRRIEPKDDLALTILTFVGFIVSIICLLALLITYSVFKELRTLPGKNLMSLSISLCVAEILWLCGSLMGEIRAACTFVAIANHYFFLVFFMATSVIAFHSCLVFGRKVSFRRRKAEDNKTFLVYSLVVWGIPALFVLISSLLDHYEVFISNYGKSDICWLGTREARLFLFILPFGILLSFNLLLFVFVALRLHKNQKTSADVLGKNAKKRQRENVIVCIKLSTLMGFSWLFGLLQASVETKTDVFSYLFVIFVSFQGLFICVAFLFKRRYYELYSTFISKNITGSSLGTGQGTQSNRPRNNDQHIHEETLL